MYSGWLGTFLTVMHLREDPERRIDDVTRYKGTHVKNGFRSGWLAEVQVCDSMRGPMEVHLCPAAPEH